MAKCYTTSEDLTSIANAIRAKTGDESSLVYPSGFVSAINSISGTVFDPRGEHITKIAEYNQSFKLSTTSISSYTTSSSNTVIKNTESIGTASTLDSNYDYFLQLEGGINYAYKGTYEQKSMITEYYYYCYYPIGKKPNYLADFTSQSYNYTTYLTSTIIHGLIYYSSGGTLSYSNNSYGITFNPIVPDFTNRLATAGYQLNTPQIRANMNNGYMNEAAYTALDPENTDIYYTIGLYQIDTTDMYRYMQQRLYQLYQQNHSNT